jgi:hypothetical protein
MCVLTVISNHYAVKGISSAYTISRQAQKGISEAPRGQLAMNLWATILRQGISKL